MSSDRPDPLAPPEGLTAATSGSADAQNPSTAVATVGSTPTVPPSTVEEQRHLGAALRSFAEPGSAISIIAVAAWQDSQERIVQCQSRLDIAEDMNASLRDELSTERSRRLVAEEKEQGLRRVKRSAKVLELVGAVVAGTGLPLLVTGNAALGIPLILVGAVLLWAGVNLEDGGAHS